MSATGGNAAGGFGGQSGVDLANLRQGINAGNKSMNSMYQAPGQDKYAGSQSTATGPGMQTPNVFNPNFMNRNNPMMNAPQGPPLPSEFLTPMGPMEKMFGNMAQAGPSAFGSNFMNQMAQGNVPGLQASPFIQSMANGQIPPGMMAQFQDQMKQQNASILDSMGGARFGSDASGIMSREYGRGLNTLLANTEQNALGAGGLMGQLATQRGQAALGANQGLMSNWLNVANPVLAAEQGRLNAGKNMQVSQFQSQQGLPPEVVALMSLMGVGGGTSTAFGNTSKQKF